MIAPRSNKDSKIKLLTIILFSFKCISVEGMPCCILSAADGLPVEASPFSFKAGISFSVTCYIIFRFWQLIQLKERLTDYERKRKHKEGLYLFYSEKDYCCYSFKYDDKGFLVEDKDKDYD